MKIFVLLRYQFGSAFETQLRKRQRKFPAVDLYMDRIVVKQMWSCNAISGIRNYTYVYIKFIREYNARFLGQYNTTARTTFINC